MDSSTQWEKTLRNLKLPRYKDLPEMPLYLEQVLEFVNKSLIDLYPNNNPPLTANMVNNYVKHKLMPPPYKKRYSRDHLAYIITITVLKQVVSIPNVVLGIKTVREQFGKEQAYNIFVDVLEEGLTIAYAMTYGGMSQKTIQFDPILVPIRGAALAFASKIIAEHGLEKSVLNSKGEK